MLNVIRRLASKMIGYYAISKTLDAAELVGSNRAWHQQLQISTQMMGMGQAETLIIQKKNPEMSAHKSRG